MHIVLYKRNIEDFQNIAERLIETGRFFPIFRSALEKGKTDFVAGSIQALVKLSKRYGDYHLSADLDFKDIFKKQGHIETLAKAVLEVLYHNHVKGGEDDFNTVFSVVKFLVPDTLHDYFFSFFPLYLVEKAEKYLDDKEFIDKLFLRICEWRDSSTFDCFSQKEVVQLYMERGMRFFEKLYRRDKKLFEKLLMRAVSRFYGQLILLFSLFLENHNVKLNIDETYLKIFKEAKSQQIHILYTIVIDKFIKNPQRPYYIFPDSFNQHYFVLRDKAFDKLQVPIDRDDIVAFLERTIPFFMNVKKEIHTVLASLGAKDIRLKAIITRLPSDKDHMFFYIKARFPNREWLKYLSVDFSLDERVDREKIRHALALDLLEGNRNIDVLAKRIIHEMKTKGKTLGIAILDDENVEKIVMVFGDLATRERSILVMYANKNLGRIDRIIKWFSP